MDGDVSDTFYRVVSVCVYPSEPPAASIYCNLSEALEVYGALIRDSDIKMVTLTSCTREEGRRSKETKMYHHNTDENVCKLVSNCTIL